MKKILSIISIFLLVSCKDTFSPAPVPNAPDITSLLITPNVVDSRYLVGEESHYVAVNKNKKINKLFLFIGGTSSSPRDYNLICNHAASLGFDAISLSYPNSVAAAPLGDSSDPMVFDNYRDEICFGNPVSNNVSVNELNSITERTLKLLQYLKQNRPSENWSQYLDSQGTIDWLKVTVVGHSQGAGHACYLAKKKIINRVVMLSGPSDFHTYFYKPANWITKSGQTPVSHFYGLLHINDEAVPYSYQVKIMEALGTLGVSQTPFMAINMKPPYANSQILSIDIIATSAHNSTVGANTNLPLIWNYLFVNN